MKVCDVHCHLLPGLDDGPDTLDDTLALLHAAWEGGTRLMVATPHLYADFFPRASPDTIRETFRATRGEIERLSGHRDYDFLRQIDLRLGAEHYCDFVFLEALARDEVLPLDGDGGGRHLLIEFPTSLPETAVHAAAVRVLQAGYRPVLAHVERYAFVQERPSGLQRFVDMGCLVQVNADGSRRFGGSERLQRSLLAGGLVHLLASDGHGTAHRPPDLGPRAEPLVRAFSERAVRAWVWENPRAILGSSG